jgi:hypothetical protein
MVDVGVHLCHQLYTLLNDSKVEILPRPAINELLAIEPDDTKVASPSTTATVRITAATSVSTVTPLSSPLPQSITTIVTTTTTTTNSATTSSTCTPSLPSPSPLSSTASPLPVTLPPFVATDYALPSRPYIHHVATRLVAWHTLQRFPFTLIALPGLDRTVNTSKLDEYDEIPSDQSVTQLICASKSIGCMH